MVEVFKTNVMDRRQAQMLVDQIHQLFKNYHSNFDLEDCDKILRIECNTELVCAKENINLVKTSK